MRHRYQWSLLATVLIALGSTSIRAIADHEGLIVWEGRPVAGEASTLVRARPEVRDALLRLDAFVVRGSTVVYVVRQSALLRGAMAGSSIHVHALAAVLWPELAHAEGADEREARAREQALWTSFIRDQRVDRVDGLRYLSVMERRPDDQLLARASQ